jgi:hypothetical protein
MKIENRLSTLTNEIKENLSLLGDGCSLLTSRREILLLGSVRESIMTPSKTSSEKTRKKPMNRFYSNFPKICISVKETIKI